MTALVALRRALHARPELAFTEIETAARVVAELAPLADSVEAGAAVVGPQPDAASSG